MKYNKLLLNILLLLGLSACNNRKTTTISPTLQAQVDSILENKLTEIDALSGQAIVMEVQTGEIKTMAGFEKKNNVFRKTTNQAYKQETGLMHPISLLAALESGTIGLSDTVDVGDGIYQIHNKTIRDHNWKRGGYGKVTFEEGIMVSSHISTIIATEKAFGNNPHMYFNILDKMSYGKPDYVSGIEDLESAVFSTPDSADWNDIDLSWFSIGYNQRISPIQVLTFYNAIANDGKMVQPQLSKGPIEVINPQIASKANIAAIKQVLSRTVSEGIGRMAASDKVQVAGKSGSVLINDNEYAVSFCGYFPADNPTYSVIISFNKRGLPAYGGMAADVFKKIVDSI